MKIEITGEPKEIAALVLELQGRQVNITNQLMLDTVNNAAAMKDRSFGDTILASNNSVDVNIPVAAD